MTRGSLAGVRTRLDRLVGRHRGQAADEFAERVKIMTDEELEWRMLHGIETMVGPFRGDDVAETIVARFSRAIGWEESRGASFLAPVRAHLNRLHWFDTHGPHGVPELIRVDPEPPGAKLFGRHIVVSCPCEGSRPLWARSLGLLSTYVDLVPDWFRQEVEHADIPGGPESAS